MICSIERCKASRLKRRLVVEHFRITFEQKFIERESTYLIIETIFDK